MKNRKLLIATRSAGKFPEIVAGLGDVPFEIINLNDVEELPKDFEVEEPAKTFEGNAIIKAMTLGKKTGYLTLADDTGLEVDALDGRPGVHTARYAQGTDEDRYNKLLEEMKDVDDEDRTARFRTFIAIYDPTTDKVRTCQGVYEGKILRKPEGTNGFGYDPVFWSLELKKSGGLMSLEEKNKVSHRGKAVRKAKELLKEFE